MASIHRFPDSSAGRKARICKTVVLTLGVILLVRIIGAAPDFSLVNTEFKHEAGRTVQASGAGVRREAVQARGPAGVTVYTLYPDPRDLQSGKLEEPIPTF